MEGNRKQVEGKGIRICLWIWSGRKDNDGGYLSFLITISLGAQDQLSNLKEPMKTKSVGHKSVGPLVQEILGISRQRNQRWGLFWVRGRLDSRCHRTWTHTLRNPSLDFPEKWQSGQGESQKLQHLSSEGVWALWSLEFQGVFRRFSGRSPAKWFSF